MANRLIRYLHRQISTIQQCTQLRQVYHSLNTHPFTTIQRAGFGSLAPRTSAPITPSPILPSPSPSITSSPPAPTANSCSRSRPSTDAPSRPISPDELLDTIRRAQTSTPTATQPIVSPLTDSFGRFHNYLRISLTERCNLRCVYCMPEEGVDLTPNESLMSSAEVKRLLELFVRQGVTKVRFTGGEPTVRKDLLDIIQHAGSLRPQGLDAVCLTTNGLVLGRKLPSLIQAGLTHVNISLDTLDEHKFQIMTRRMGGKQVRQSIMDAVAALTPPGTTSGPGLRSVKINSVIMKGLNEDEILDFVDLTKDHRLEVRFIEYMPFDGNRWTDKKFVSMKEMLDRIRTKYPDIAREPVEKNETAKSWRVPGHAGKVGFISSMSDHFCSTCNRLRMTADGNLKVCLFGPQEVSLRDAIRQGKTDEELSLIIGAAVQKKKAQHAGMVQLSQQKNRPMITIGDVVNGWLTTSNSSATSSRTRSASSSHNSSSPMYLPIAARRCFLSQQQRMVSTLGGCRSFSSNATSIPHGLTHVDSTGTRPTMVDVSDKTITKRTALAQSLVLLPENVGKLFSEEKKDWNTPKGPVLVTAIIAGTSAVKATSTLIPFCHPLPLDGCRILIDFIVHPHPLGQHALQITCRASCTGKTGVEMEALTGASVAALTCYDMLKAISHDLVITDTKLIKKTGGKSDYNVPKTQD